MSKYRKPRPVAEAIAAAEMSGWDGVATETAECRIGTRTADGHPEVFVLLKGETRDHLLRLPVPAAVDEVIASLIACQRVAWPDYETEPDDPECDCPTPIGLCPSCGRPFYIEGGFCGVCHPGMV